MTTSGGGITLESFSNMSNKPTPSKGPQADVNAAGGSGAGGDPLKRVLSSGSGAGNEGGVTPTLSSKPLSPSAGGASTPRAPANALKPEGEQLATDLNGLQVQTPMDIDTPRTTSSNGQQSATGPTPRRGNSTSTDSSESARPPHVPPSFGSSYGPEGFPALTNVSESGEPMSSSDLQMSAQAAAAIAAADEAIKQLNGTSSVIQGVPGPIDGPFALPRGYADFVNLQSRSDRRSSPEPGIHRQTSTSSSVTEASTSSEESDLCVPRIEWVNVVNPSSPNSFGSAYNFQQQGKHNLKSPNRMPPPTTNAAGRKITSPRRTSADRPGAPAHQASLPLGATARSPKGLASTLESALPGDINPNAPAEEDDDSQTVGQGRERSHSSSSESNKSGLDLLWHAAQGPKPDGPGPNTNSPYDPPQSHDGKGKRKAGAAAVAQWRATSAGGLATGGSNDAGSSEMPATLNAAKLEDGPAAAGVPKKRRRSEIEMAIDPALRDEDLVVSDFVNENAMDMEDSTLNHADVDVENRSDAGSESGASVDSHQDPEYKGQNTPSKSRTGVRTKSTPGKKAGKATPGRASTSGTGTAANGSTSKRGASGKKARKTDSPGRGGGGGGGGGKKRGPGAAEAPAATANVQCEYVNPLPPYNRCQDVFTRKYDLPRHMARHARREGELVFEGKLAEDKALLWKTIKDKPKVTCSACGESFTRMDALKRHQTKQHH